MSRVTYIKKSTFELLLSTYKATFKLRKKAIKNGFESFKFVFVLVLLFPVSLLVSYFTFSFVVTRS